MSAEVRISRRSSSDPQSGAPVSFDARAEGSSQSISSCTRHAPIARAHATPRSPQATRASVCDQRSDRSPLHTRSRCHQRIRPHPKPHTDDVERNKGSDEDPRGILNSDADLGRRDRRLARIGRIEVDRLKTSGLPFLKRSGDELPDHGVQTRASSCPGAGRNSGFRPDHRQTP